jgi:hypothetical protein
MGSAVALFLLVCVLMSSRLRAAPSTQPSVWLDSVSCALLCVVRCCWVVELVKRWLQAVVLMWCSAVDGWSMILLQNLGDFAEQLSGLSDGLRVRNNVGWWRLALPCCCVWVEACRVRYQTFWCLLCVLVPSVLCLHAFSPKLLHACLVGMLSGRCRVCASWLWCAHVHLGVHFSVQDGPWVLQGLQLHKLKKLVEGWC